MYNFSNEVAIPLIIVVGIVSSFIASIIGLGGGLVAIPLIILVIGEHNLEAKLISYVSIAALSIMATFKYYRQRRKPDWIPSILILVGVIPMTIISELYLAPKLNSEELKPIFHFLYAIVAFCVIFIVNFKDKIKMKKINNIYLPIIGIFIGVLTGSIGLSGGVIFIPLLVVGLKKTLKEAAVTSLALKLGTAITNIMAGAISGQYSSFENNGVQWYLPIIIIVGALIGSFIGPIFQKRISNRSMIIIFNLVISSIVIWEIIDGLLIFYGLM